MPERDVQLVAHRGDPHGQVENTLAGFRAAAEAGVPWIELDVRASRDSEVAVIHDRTTRRIWGARKSVATQPWHRLQEHQHPSGAGIPRLAEVLQAVPHTKVLIDAVDAASARLATSLARDLRDVGGVAFCGAIPALQAVRHAWPEASIWLTSPDGALPHALLAAELRPAVWNSDHRKVTPSAIDAAHRRGLQVCCWVVNEPTRARQLAAWGTDFITSNNAVRWQLEGTLRPPART